MKSSVKKDSLLKKRETALKKNLKKRRVHKRLIKKENNASSLR
jgi:hypothetical protein